MNLTQRAAKLLHDFKGDNYLFGLNVLDRAVSWAAGFGETALVISNTTRLKTRGRASSCLLGETWSKTSRR